jgi:hypothetical protein
VLLGAVCCALPSVGQRLDEVCALLCCCCRPFVVGTALVSLVVLARDGSSIETWYDVLSCVLCCCCRLAGACGWRQVLLRARHSRCVRCSRPSRNTL